MVADKGVQQTVLLFYPVCVLLSFVSWKTMLSINNNRGREREREREGERLSAAGKRHRQGYIWI